MIDAKEIATCMPKSGADWGDDLKNRNTYNFKHLQVLYPKVTPQKTEN